MGDGERMKAREAFEGALLRRAPQSVLESQLLLVWDTDQAGVEGTFSGGVFGRHSAFCPPLVHSVALVTCFDFFKVGRARQPGRSGRPEMLCGHREASGMPADGSETLSSWLLSHLGGQSLLHYRTVCLFAGERGWRRQR